MTETPPNSIHPATRAAWRAWLEQHHGHTEGVWLISSKRAAGKPRLGYDETVEEALCFGWIDSTARTLDDERTLQWFAPRKPRSGWSTPNKHDMTGKSSTGRPQSVSHAFFGPPHLGSGPLPLVAPTLDRAER